MERLKLRYKADQFHGHLKASITLGGACKSILAVVFEAFHVASNVDQIYQNTLLIFLYLLEQEMYLSALFFPSNFENSALLLFEKTFHTKWNCEPLESSPVLSQLLHVHVHITCSF